MQMESIGRYSDFHRYLKDIFEFRLSSNPNYSRKAFADDLRITPQMLSLILNGKKNISAKFAMKLGLNLGLTVDDLCFFLDLVEYTQTNSESLKEILKYRMLKHAVSKSSYHDK